MWFSISCLWLRSTRSETTAPPVPSHTRGPGVCAVGIHEIISRRPPALPGDRRTPFDSLKTLR